MPPKSHQKFSADYTRTLSRALAQLTLNLFISETAGALSGPSRYATGSCLGRKRSTTETRANNPKQPSCQLKNESTISTMTSPDMHNAITPIVKRPERAPRKRKMLATAPNKNTGLIKTRKYPESGFSVNCQNHMTRIELKSANHSMPRIRCVFMTV